MLTSRLARKLLPALIALPAIVLLTVLELPIWRRWQ